jgi:penicillin amidase
VYREVIDIKGGGSQAVEIRETIWGPVDDVDYPDGEIAVSWIAHKPEAVNLRLIALETAENVAAALDIANTMGMPPQNFVTGDTGGNIGWTIAGRIPVKTDFNAMVPADWSQEHGWMGWLDPAEYPRIVNPDSGRIWTANARVADGDALAVIGDGGYDLGARARQIRDRLAEKDSFNAEDMLRIQIDDRALFLAPWRKLLLDVLDEKTIAGDAELAELRRLVNEWIPRAAPDSTGYRLVRAFRLEVRSIVFHGLMGPVRDVYGDDVNTFLSSQFEAPLWSIMTERPMHMLPARYESWHALLVAAVRANIAWFNDNYEGSLAQRTWGERNAASIQHPLSGAIPALSKWLDMPREPLSGDHDMPKAQGRDFGASERFSVSPGDEASGLMQMPAGQSGHPLSDFYRQGHDDWVHGRPSPYLPGETLHTLTLTPAS